MGGERNRKIVYFVSTGRCGTKRIAEILENHLPSKEFSVQHQMDVSRISNVLGNLMFYLGSWEWLKMLLFKHILNKYAKEKHFICTDPLTSMIIPRQYIINQNVYIIHIIRNKNDFAESFFRFSRKRFLSFFAHNFIPLWQIGIWPLENLLNKKIISKYKKVWKNKNNWMEKTYKKNENYQKISMEELFGSKIIENIMKKSFDIAFRLDMNLLGIKANESKL